MRNKRVEYKNDLILNVNPKGFFSESIRNVRTNLQFSSVDKRNKVFLVTSCEPGDGKSFITANLALAYAQDNKKVLIVDCDLRKGRQYKIFNLHNSITAGYTNLILNYDQNTDLRKYVMKTSIYNLDLIPNGLVPPNPVELLSSSRNEEIIKRLRNEYDVILLDCPPVLGLSDTLILTKLSDVNILVVSNKRTKFDLLEQAKKAFEKVNAKVAGVIINRSNVKDTAYSGYYIKDYYVDK